MWKKLSSSCQFYNFYLAQVYTKVGIQGVLGLGSKFIEIQVDVIFIPSFRRIKPLHRPAALVRDPRAPPCTHLDELFYQGCWTIGPGGYTAFVHSPQIQQMQIPNKIKGSSLFHSISTVPFVVRIGISAHYCLETFQGLCVGFPKRPYYWNSIEMTTHDEPLKDVDCELVKGTKNWDNLQKHNFTTIGSKFHFGSKFSIETRNDLLIENLFAFIH